MLRTYCIASITVINCTHLVIDAGHIAIESDLADKKAVKDVYLKRNENYGDEDWKRLESLMYDKFSLRLEAAQVRCLVARLKLR